MALFQYRGVDNRQTSLEGEIHAPSAAVASKMLHELDITPVSIAKVGFISLAVFFLKQMLSFFFPIRKMHMRVLYSQLADLLEADVSMKHALSLLAEQAPHFRLARVMQRVAQQVADGGTLAGALNAYPRIFSQPVIRSVALANSREELVSVFRFGAEVLGRSGFWVKLLTVMVPQLTLFWLMLAVALFIDLHYVKDFMVLVTQLGQAVPVTVTLLHVFSMALTSQLVTTILVVIVSIILFNVLLNKVPLVNYYYGWLKSYVPVFGRYSVSLERERLSIVMSNMLAGGVSFQKTLRFGVSVLTNAYFRVKAATLVAEMMKGESLESLLKKYRIFSKTEIQMITLGIQSMNLPEVFRRIFVLNQRIIDNRIIVIVEFFRLLGYAVNISFLIFLIMTLEALFYTAPLS